MEQVARCNNLIGSKFLIPLFAFFSSPSSSYRVIAKRLKKIVLKNPTSPRYPSKEQALPEESRSFLSIQISRHPRFFHGKWRRKKNRGKSRLAWRFIRKLRLLAHAKNLPRACVRACASACCAFSLQSELRQKARPDPSRCPLTDFYATIIR